MLYLKLQLHVVSNYNLRSAGAPLLFVPIKEQGNFQDIVARSFNRLPASIRKIEHYPAFVNAIKADLFTKAKARLE